MGRRVVGSFGGGGGGVEGGGGGRGLRFVYMLAEDYKYT